MKETIATIEGGRGEKKITHTHKQVNDEQAHYLTDRPNVFISVSYVV